MRRIPVSHTQKAPGDENAPSPAFADLLRTRFGRYPHRNAVLGRVSTEEELAFLKEPGSSF